MNTERGGLDTSNTSLTILELKNYLNNPDDLKMVIDITMCSLLGARERINSSIEQEYKNGTVNRVGTNLVAGGVIGGVVLPTISEGIRSLVSGIDIAKETPLSVLTKALSTGIAVAIWQEIGHRKQRERDRRIIREGLAIITEETVKQAWNALDGNTKDRINAQINEANIPKP